jgi:hypothetical protein
VEMPRFWIDVGGTNTPFLLKEDILFLVFEYARGGGVLAMHIQIQTPGGVAMYCLQRGNITRQRCKIS